MGDSGEGDDEERSNNAGTCDDIQGGVSGGATLWEQEMDIDGGNAEGDGGVPPSDCL